MGSNDMNGRANTARRDFLKAAAELAGEHCVKRLALFKVGADAIAPAFHHPLACKQLRLVVVDVKDVPAAAFAGRPRGLGRIGHGCHGIRAPKIQLEPAALPGFAVHDDHAFVRLQDAVHD